MKSPSLPDIERAPTGQTPAHRHLYYLILTALCAAILVIAQVALSFLANIELVSLLVVLYTRTFRWRALPAIYVFVLAEGLLYGFGIWWCNYLYIWGLLWLLVTLLPKLDSAIYYAAVTGVFGLLFGLLCALPYLLVGGPAMALSYFLAGIKFDLLHAVGNVAVALLLYRPLSLVLRRVRI